MLVTNVLALVAVADFEDEYFQLNKIRIENDNSTKFRNSHKRVLAEVYYPKIDLQSEIYLSSISSINSKDIPLISG